MSNVSIDAQVERVTQPFWESKAPSADPFQNVFPAAEDMAWVH
jgi:hypothetical protein